MHVVRSLHVSSSGEGSLYTDAAAAGSCVAPGPGDEATYCNWLQPLGLGLGRPVRKLRARVASLRMYIHAYA